MVDEKKTQGDKNQLGAGSCHLLKKKKMREELVCARCAHQPRQQLAATWLFLFYFFLFSFFFFPLFYICGVDKKFRKKSNQWEVEFLRLNEILDDEVYYLYSQKTKKKLKLLRMLLERLEDWHPKNFYGYK